ncbi:MaoC family dehydratase [Sulfitobacter sp. HNIBRBA3233]|uniref:MaoC family dehydratase n=1 Tax=Sulfitobacter marinivivus TaxID=3158558 RepID=UPI0032DF0C4A
MTDLTFASMAGMIGAPLGTSSWHEVTQDAVNEFAHCTGDSQWIHTDVERARRESPFGGPVAHGYLTLSLLSAMAMEIGVVPAGTAAALNYGLDKVRFLAPVPVGARLRLTSKLTGFDRKPNGQYLMKTENTMEIEGSDRPALLAESLAILVPGPEAET